MQESPVTKQVERSIKNEKKSGITNDFANLNEEEIKKKYENAIKLLWANKYEKAEEEAFQQLDYEECTEDQCIRLIQEFLQVEKLF